MDDAAAHVTSASATLSSSRQVLAERAAVFLTAAVSVAALASANGGYFWSSWSWACLAFAAIAGAALMLRAPARLGRPSALFLSLLGALVGWTLLSLVWAPSGAPVFEAERTLVYLTGAYAVLVAVRRDTVPYLIGGVLAGLFFVDLYALGTRVLPDRLTSAPSFAANRLERSDRLLERPWTRDGDRRLARAWFRAARPHVWRRAPRAASCCPCCCRRCTSRSAEDPGSPSASHSSHSSRSTADACSS